MVTHNNHILQESGWVKVHYLDNRREEIGGEYIDDAMSAEQVLVFARLQKQQYPVNFQLTKVPCAQGVYVGQRGCVLVDLHCTLTSECMGATAHFI